MNISRDQFIKIIDSIVEQEKHDRITAIHLDLVVRSGGNRNLVFTTPMIDTIVDALDYEDVISWWLWDGPQHGEKAEDFPIYLGDVENPRTKKFIINNSGDLYDYIEKAKKCEIQ